MTETIDLDSDGKPIGTTSQTASSKTFAASPETSGLVMQPVQFTTATTLQSPFFWVIVGIGITIAGYWFMKKKM
jgi:hypothetical protein